MANDESGELLVDAPDLSAPIPTSVESRTTFRLARLLLFLAVASDRGRPVPSVDRLAYYEFFADNPFIIIEGNSASDDADRLTLEMAGFSPVQLSYASSAQRFASRRQRLKHDLALLVSRDLVRVGTTGYEATALGEEIASALNSIYADAYRASASIVLRRLSSLSGAALERLAQRWLGESWLLIDLLDDIGATDAPTLTDGVRPDHEPTGGGQST
jgi:hypothetical protein